MKEISLTRGKVALVDDEDFDWVNQFKWYACKGRRRFYGRRTRAKAEGGGKQLLHHFICPKWKFIDHKNGNGLDNQKENLRASSTAQNLRAYCLKAVGRTSRFRGVSWGRRDEKWAAGIRVSPKKVFLGYFDKEEDAAKAFDRAAIRFGFAREALNFPT